MLRARAVEANLRRLLLARERELGSKAGVVNYLLQRRRLNKGKGGGTSGKGSGSGSGSSSGAVGAGVASATNEGDGAPPVHVQ